MENKDEEKITDFAFDRERFVLYKNDDILEDYDVSDTLLGKGAFGSVLKGVHKSTGQERALKFIPRSVITRKIERFVNEVSALK